MPISLRKFLTVLCLSGALSTHADEPTASAADARSAQYQILERYAHNTTLFTQGLELYKGRLFESSGLYGHSKVISRHFPPREEPDLKGLALPATAFAEGLTIYRDRIYLLTWRAQQGLILDAEHFGVLGGFAYQGEGWGLCYNSRLGDDGAFVMSNGSAQLQWLSPKEMKPLGKVTVTEGGKAIDKLNELECVGGLVVANIWHSNDIVVIDAATGKVLRRIDLSALQPEVSSDQAVLNGIAYDAEDDSWLVTGKFWPVIYRIRFALPDLQQ